eukprot:3215665-Amphidinium_carterae.1
MFGAAMLFKSPYCCTQPVLLHMIAQRVKCHDCPHHGFTMGRQADAYAASDTGYGAALARGVCTALGHWPSSIFS